MPFRLHPACWPALALLALYAVFYLQFAAQLIAYPFDVDQGEGYDAWSGWLLDRGQLPYTPNTAFPYYSSSYPPVWSYLVSLPMAWLGPGLAPARAVSALAALLAAVVVGTAARQRGASAVAGILALLLFLGSPYVFHTTPLARVNGTALLFSVLALRAFEVPTRRRVWLGSVALLVALFTKPTAVDAAVAGLGAVLLRAPARGLVASAALAAAGLGVFALLTWGTGGAFWLNVVQAKVAIPSEPERLAAYALNLIETHGILLVLAASEAVRAARRGDWSPWVLFFPATLALALLSVAKAGSGESYYLGTAAAASVLAATALVRWLESRSRWTLPLAGALLAQALLFSHGPLSQAVSWLPDRGLQADVLGRAPTAEMARAGAEVVALLRAASSPVLAEDPSFAVQAGKPVVGNAAHLHDLYRGGLYDPSALVSDVEARRFGAVVLDAQQYPGPVLEAIGRSYYLARVVETTGARYQVFLPGRE